MAMRRRRTDCTSFPGDVIASAICGRHARCYRVWSAALADSRCRDHSDTQRRSSPSHCQWNLSCRPLRRIALPGAAAALVLPFAELSLADVAAAGGKGSNLGELARAGLPVPPGFVITAQPTWPRWTRLGYERGCWRELPPSRPTIPSRSTRCPRRLRESVLHAGIPEATRRAIADAYRALGKGRVAVRSSATLEDTAGFSFAGMNETYTNIEGEEALEAAVKRCWASLWGHRVVAYRASQGITTEPAIAVIVQRMVDSETSGVMFTADPSGGARNRLVIEAAFGLGEVVVSGQVEPDTYMVDKSGPSVQRRAGRRQDAPDHAQRRRRAARGSRARSARAPRADRRADRDRGKGGPHDRGSLWLAAGH